MAPLCKEKNTLFQSVDEEMPERYGHLPARSGLAKGSHKATEASCLNFPRKCSVKLFIRTNPNSAIASLSRDAMLVASIQNMDDAFFSKICYIPPRPTQSPQYLLVAMNEVVALHFNVVEDFYEILDNDKN